MSIASGERRDWNADRRPLATSPFVSDLLVCGEFSASTSMLFSLSPGYHTAIVCGGEVNGSTNKRCKGGSANSKRLKVVLRKRLLASCLSDHGEKARQGWLAQA